MIDTFIQQETAGYNGILEMGSMLFDKLGYATCTGPRVGIEIHQPYIDNPKAVAMRASKNIIALHGDMRDFESLIEGYTFDLCMFSDTIEHLPKEDIVPIIKRCQQLFKKILIFCPEGNCPQNKDVLESGGDLYQTHFSEWSKEDLEELGFSVYVNPTFHGWVPEAGRVVGALFATWKRVD